MNSDKGVAMAATGTIRIYRPDPATVNDDEQCGRARFTVCRLSATRFSVTVSGEIDATNGRAMGRYIERHTGTSKQLIVDLRPIDFFGGLGFTALYYVSVHCARNDVDWMIVGSPCVRRLLNLCDPQNELPLVDDLDTALARLDHLARYQHITYRLG
jgi:anti-anti-sigma factor